MIILQSQKCEEEALIAYAKTVKPYARTGYKPCYQMFLAKTNISHSQIAFFLKQKLLLLIIFMTFINVWSQTTDIDSLKTALKSAGNIEAKNEIRLELSDALSGKDPEQSKIYAEQILANNLKASPEQIARAYLNIGYAYWDWSHYDSALVPLAKAANLAKHWEDKNLYLRIASNQVSCYRNIGNYDKAFEVGFEALEIAEETENYRRAASLSGRIGDLYRGQNETDLAIKYLNLSLEYFEKAEFERGILGSMVNLALAHKQKDPAKGLSIIESAIERFHPIFSTYDSAQVLSNMANINMDLEHYRVAEQQLLLALECHKRLNRIKSKAFCYKELAEIYLRTERYQKAVEYANKALSIANEYGHFHLQHQCHDQLALGYEKLGQHEKAYEHIRQYLSYNDSIITLEKIELSNELEARYAGERKQQQIQLQEEQLARQKADIRRESTLRNALSVGFVLLLLVAFLIYRNLRVLSKKNQEIQELQTTQSRWFTNIAHELRTPLTLILGPLQKLVKKSPSKEAKLANRYGKQLMERVNEILEISRLESGKLSLVPQPTELVFLIKSTLSAFDSLAEQQSIKLKFHSELKELQLKIDAEKVRTILNNLLSNALKFTPAGGNVIVELIESTSEKAFEIKVSDSGIGIDKSDLPHLFDRFYQAKQARQEQYGGSGVGLTLSQELAKLHEGEIRVKSEKGKGSCFSLILPQSLKCEVAETIELVQSEKETSTNLEENKPTIPKPHQACILLVEDHPDMRQYIRSLLESHYSVIEAQNGKVGLEKIKEQLPDLIISDVKMPIMDGLTFAKQLKNKEEFRSLPFITLTAHANERDKLIALRTGVDDYLVKPFQEEELLARVENLIKNAKARKKAELETPELSHEEEQIAALEQLVLEKLEQSYFGIKELAKESGMSESSLSRLVKRMTGLTPGQFVRDLRLQQAIRYLEVKKYATIAEVCFAVGFEDASSFSRLFKKRFGKSPKEYLG